MKENFGDTAFEAVQAKGSCVVVGLDPVWERIPSHLCQREHGSQGSSHCERSEAISRFCCEIVEATEGVAAAVKPQIAFFERYGPAGLEAFGEVCRFAHSRGLLVIADVKRGDIGSTSKAYAEAYLGEGAFGQCVDAITVNPYLGKDALQPFFDLAEEHGKGVFVLVRTSNPGAADIQDAVVVSRESRVQSLESRPHSPKPRAQSPEPRVFEHVASLVGQWAGEGQGEHGYSHIGAVVGATYPEQARKVREILPYHWLLVPGYGAQGATALDLKGLFDENKGGVLVNASRSIIYAWEREDLGEPFGEGHFERAARVAAEKMRDEINAVR